MLQTFPGPFLFLYCSRSHVPELNLCTSHDGSNIVIMLTLSLTPYESYGTVSGPVPVRLTLTPVDSV